VRPAADTDAERLAMLCEQLGYPTSPEAVSARLARLAQDPDHAVFVADDGAGCVMGWVHVHAVESLVAGRYAEIGGLVVDAGARRAGAGRQLMLAAEAWARAHGCSSVRLRSNVVRAEAHEFYRRLGYEVVKTQLAFRKVV
jgi:GNAT superfamily N-acetyltransferase